MKLAALVSGGKDSLYAIYLAIKQGHEIKTILCMQSENPESYMFHFPNTWIVELQARLMNIPYLSQSTAGEKELELEDLEKIIGRIGKIDGIVTGAVASNYQKQRIDKICERLSLKNVAPLWNMEPVKSIEGMIKDGFKIIIQAVAAPPMDEEWLGREINEECLSELVELNKKHGIHVNGEGGEYESLVLDCPMFSKKIVLKSTEKRWDSKTRSGMLVIRNVDTVAKYTE